MYTVLGTFGPSCFDLPQDLLVAQLAAEILQVTAATATAAAATPPPPGIVP